MWLLFTTVLLPLSFSLSLVSQAAARESAVYTWMYANNWDWNLAKNSGFWYVFRDAAMRLFLSLLTIASWPWSTGFVLGIVPRKILLTSRTLLFLLLALCQLGNLPQRFTFFLMGVVGVSLDEDGWKVVKPFIRATPVRYRIVLGNNSIAKAYAIGQMPDTFLVDRQGRVAATYVGMVDRNSLEKNIRELLVQK